MKTIQETINNNLRNKGVRKTDSESDIMRSVWYDAGFKDAVKFAQQWIPIEKELPLAYESGRWDGLRSDFVLAKNKHGNWFKARAYQGIIDGHEFCDFCDESDVVLSHIIEWRPVMLS
jgi:hypothetical protein